MKSVIISRKSSNTGRVAFGNRTKRAAFFGNKSFFGKCRVQTKLIIGEPDDKYEKEADTVADKLMQAPDHTSATKSDQAVVGNISSWQPAVQSKCAGCEQEEKEKDESNPAMEATLQLKPIFESRSDDEQMSTVQKKCDDCEDEEVQAKRSGDDSVSPSSLETALHQSGGSGSPMPGETRMKMETAFGKDFSDVRIHQDSSAIALSEELQAKAFTHGSNIYFNKGNFDPASLNGMHLLGHELTHVVQQSGGNGHQPVQRDLFDALSPDAMVKQMREKKEAAEKAAIEQYLQQNKPECLKTAFGVASAAQKFIAGENVDKGNLAVLRERINFFRQEMGRVELWLTKKEGLTKEEADKLNADKQLIIELLSTPLSLNKNIDVSKFTLEEMQAELQRIDYWMSAGKPIPDDGGLADGLQKIIILTKMSEDPPVFMALDTRSMKRYLNVKHPGYSLKSISFYLYGDPGKTYFLSNPDGSPAAEFIAAGSSLIPDQASFPQMTHLASSQKIQMKTDGISTDLQGAGGEIIDITLEDQVYHLTDPQMKVLMASMFKRSKALYKIELEYLEDQLKVYSDHKNDTNWLVRKISDTAGGADFDSDYFKMVIKQAKPFATMLNSTAEADINPQLVNEAYYRLNGIKAEGEKIEKQLMSYMNDTVTGASRAVTTLEVVKTAGSIAANFVPGLGIVYGGIQDAAQQASGMAMGVQDEWNWKSTRNNLVMGVASFGVGKGIGAVGKGLGQMGSKYLPQFAGKIAELAKTPAFTSGAGKFFAGTAGNVAQNVAGAPILKHIDKLTSEGRFATYDEIITDLGDQFSVKNLALAGASTAMQGRLPEDIHIAGANKKNNPTMSQALAGQTTAKPTPPAIEQQPVPVPVTEPTAKITDSDFVKPVSEDATAITSSDKILAEEPVKIGKEEHEAVVTKDGVGVCSPHPCPVIHVEYAKELADNKKFADDYLEIKRLRNAGEYETAAAAAVNLIGRMEAARLTPGTTVAGAPDAPVPLTAGKTKSKFSTEEIHEHLGEVTEDTNRVPSSLDEDFRGRPHDLPEDSNTMELKVPEGATPRPEFAPARWFQERFLLHLELARQRFREEGITPAQQAAIDQHPNLEAAYRGDQLDTFIKESIAADPELLDVITAPRFVSDPDIILTTLPHWFDVTTRRAWQAHVERYGPRYSNMGKLLSTDNPEQ